MNPSEHFSKYIGSGRSNAIECVVGRVHECLIRDGQQNISLKISYGVVE